MIEYRKKLKIRVIALSVSTIVALIVVIAGTYLTLNNEPENATFYDGLIKGMPFGLFTGFCLLMTVYIMRCSKALKSDTALQKMYVSEYDERKKAIRSSALVTSFFVMTGILIVAVTVSSLFNNIVSITLGCVLCIHALTGAIFKLYYFGKY